MINFKMLLKQNDLFVIVNLLTDAQKKLINQNRILTKRKFNYFNHGALFDGFSLYSAG